MPDKDQPEPLSLCPLRHLPPTDQLVVREQPFLHGASAKVVHHGGGGGGGS
mgnify:CR=1 FL=1|jgi:hypothetical protein